MQHAKQEDAAVHAGQQFAAALFQDQAFSQLALESIPDVFFVKDEQCRIVLGNPAFFNLYPESMHDRIIGYTTAEEYDEQQAEAFLKNDRIALEKGESTVVETLDFPDGKRRTLFTRKIRFRDSNGIAYILGIARDITEIIEGQEALKQSEQRHALAVSGAAVGIWDWDVLSGHIVWSDRALNIVGREAGSKGPEFEQYFELVHPEDRDDLRVCLEQHLGRQGPYDIVYRLLGKDGMYKWVHARGQATWDEQGNATRMAGSLEDITERKRAEMRLIQQNEQLNEFAHIASHDLKAPLRGMCTHIEMLREDFGDQLDSQIHRRLDRMQALTERMEELIVDLLKLARVVDGEKYRVSIDLRSVVESAVALIPEAEDAEILIGTLPEIACEPVSVRELFRNLIANALKYNQQSNKVVEIGSNSSADSKTTPVFFVRDNGIGIPDTYHESIFQIFRRLHGREEYGGGTGAGLTFVKRIVERHDGRIWLDSEVNHGSTFYFTLSS